MTDPITVTINGTIFSKWTAARITRSLTECASTFEFEVTERWKKDAPEPWRIKRYDSAVVAIGGLTALTGYVDLYTVSYDDKSHAVRVSGRSKTSDLVDCVPDVQPGQFDGYTLDAVAKALAAPFGIGVTVECEVGAAFPTVTIERTETAYQLLEKLARLRAVILTDNENGELVLTQAGKGGSAGDIIEGKNILSASCNLSGNQRFQKYVVLSQTPLSWDEQDAQTQIIAEATDDGVPRFRRFAEIAENPLDTAQAQARAKWRARHNAAISTEASPVMQGFRQADGGLWKINRTSYVKSPRLGIDQQLLIGRVAFTQNSESGSRTEMLVAPPAAFTPEPDPKGANNSDAVWKDAVKIH